MPKILAFSGSSRQASFNSKLVKIAASAAKNEGVEVTIVNLGDFPMPIYNADLETEQGLPEHASRFKQLLVEHDGLLISSPEYNSAFSPLLKNVIDWASRSESDDEPPLVAFRGKYAAIMSASPGALGGLRGLVFLRMLLSNIGITVIAEQQAISQAHTAFNQGGTLIDQKKQLAISNLGIKLAHMVKV